MSKIKVDTIEGSTGTTITVPTGQTLTLTDGLAATNLTGTIADARLPTVPVSKGGTGLTSLGSAGQSIKVNSGGNALEFATSSSGDFEKIAVGGSGTDVGFVSIPIDRTTYVSFEIYWQSVPTSDGGYPRIRYRNASGAISSSNYKFSYVQTQGSGGSISSEHSNGSDHIQIGGNGGYQDLEGHGFHITYTPHKTSRWGQSGGTYNGDMMTWQGYRIDENDNWRDIRGGGKYDVVIDDVTHLDFYYNTGNVSMYNYAIYGRKA